MVLDPVIEREFNEFDYFANQHEVIYRRWCRENGMSYSMYQVFARLIHVGDDGIAPSELADDFSIPRQTMTGIIDSLEGEGYAVREDDPTDRRRKIIKLTEKGHSFVAQRMDKLHEHEMTAYTSLSEDEREELGRLMRKYVDALDKSIR